MVPDNSHPNKKWLVTLGRERFLTGSVDGVPVTANTGQVNGTIDYARRDVVPLNGNNEVRVFLRFRDLQGRYVMHCHNVVHEDHAMMIRFDIGTTPPPS